MNQQIHDVYKNHDDVKFLSGNLKVLLLVYDNYIYKRINTRWPKQTWKCTYKTGCKVTVFTKNAILVKPNQLPYHSHPSPVDEICLIETNMRIRMRVQSEINLTPRQIYTEERTRLMLHAQNDVHLMLDSFPKTKSKLYKYRQARFPKNPEARRDIMIEDEWRLTLDKSETFLLANDGVDDKILIFGTESNLRILCNAEYIISDGTFTIHPDIFAQLYVFHAPYLNKVLPLLFCLLPDKTYNTYHRLLILIRNLSVSIGSIFEPKNIHVDFEAAMIKAISVIYTPECIRGCLFHFSQCIWRKIQELGIASSYNKFRHVRQWVRRFSALPFLPIEQIDDGWIAITENCPDAQNGIISAEQIEKFHKYMLATWIDDEEAKFNRQIWNQYHNEGPRTTNNAEGWNHKLNHDAKSRLSFFKFVSFVQNMQLDLDATKFNLISESPSRQRIKYKAVNESLAIAKSNFASGNVPILSYLDSVSFALKLD